MDVLEKIERGDLRIIIFSRSDLKGLYDLSKPMTKEEKELLHLAKIGQRMRWVSCNEQMPELYIRTKGRYVDVVPVLCTDGNQVFRAAYVGNRKISCNDFGYDGEADYDEATDQYYWPEGWYEWNDCEETHWNLGNDIIAWMPFTALYPLPQPPSENDRPGEDGK